jgi:hypothetical protein
MVLVPIQGVPPAGSIPREGTPNTASFIRKKKSGEGKILYGAD